MPVPIPEEVLSTLICSECHKYLSFPPVKVYPNRQMKCGRCTKDDDNGVESPNFALVTRYMKFPCINRFEGCNQLLNTLEVQEHEAVCQSPSIYFCPFCNGYCSSGYYLFCHVREHHREFELKSQEFILEIDQGDKRHLYFYTKGNTLCFVTCQFSADDLKLFLDIATLPNTEEKSKSLDLDLRQQFQLFSIDHKTSVYSTGVNKCSQLAKEVLGFDILLNKKNYAKDVVICKFNLKDEQLLSMVPENTLIDPRINFVKTECLFKKVLNLLHGNKINCAYSVFVSNIKWSMMLELTYNNFQQRSVLSAYLLCHKEGFFSYRVKVKASLVNTRKQPNIDKVTDLNFNQDSKKKLVWDLMKVDINVFKWLLFEGFIKNDCLKMEMRIKVENCNESKKRKIA